MNYYFQRKTKILIDNDYIMASMGVLSKKYEEASLKPVKKFEFWGGKIMYPRLEIDIEKLKHNAKLISQMCHERNIKIFFCY